MASITTYLNNIKSAVYGKDVRQAIYDSINAINTQVNTYTSAETSRVSAEKKRVTAETSRASAESDREDAEADREDAETSRTNEFTQMMKQADNLLSLVVERLNNLLDHTYPVGSIYISVDSSIDPSDAFGGTWELVDEGTLAGFIGTSDSYTWERTA